MKNLSINTIPYEPISSLQLNETNTPVSLNSKVKTSKHFLEHYIASYFDQPQEEKDILNYVPSFTEPNHLESSKPNHFNSSERISLIQSKTTTPSLIGKLTKLPPLVLTKKINHKKSIDFHKINKESPQISSNFLSPINKRQKLTHPTTCYTPNSYNFSLTPLRISKQEKCEKLQTIIEKCDIGIKKIADLGETIDTMIKSNNKYQTIASLNRQQRNIQNEEANLFIKSKSNSLNSLSKVETISTNYAFKNRTNYIEEYNYFNGDDNDFIFNEDAEGVLKKKKKKTTYLLMKKSKNEDRHNKISNLIQNCIQDKNIIMKRTQFP